MESVLRVNEFLMAPHHKYSYRYQGQILRNLHIRYMLYIIQRPM